MPTLKVMKSRNDRVGAGRWFRDASRQQFHQRIGEPVESTRDLIAASSLTLRMHGNQGGPAIGA